MYKTRVGMTSVMGRFPAPVRYEFEIVRVTVHLNETSFNLDFVGTSSKPST